MKLLWIVVAVAALVAGCSGTAPTPQIIYVTPAPTATPQIATPAPTATVTAPAVSLPPATPAAPALTVSPAASPDGHSVKGTGSKSTAAFALAGGDYVLTWKATATGPCFYSATLQSPTDPLVYEQAGTASFTKAGTATDTTNLFGVKAGQYFFKVNAGCDWTITVTSATATTPARTPFAIHSGDDTLSDWVGGAYEFTWDAGGCTHWRSWVAPTSGGADITIPVTDSTGAATVEVPAGRAYVNNTAICPNGAAWSLTLLRL